MDLGVIEHVDELEREMHLSPKNRFICNTVSFLTEETCMAFFRGELTEISAR